MINRRRRSITVPTSRWGFDQELRRLLGRMVMSRTRVDGRPIHRERELLDEAQAQASIDRCWCILASRSGTEVTITFELFPDRHGVVMAVLVQPPGNLRRPRPAPEIRPPSFLNYSPRIPALRRERRALLQRIHTAEERLHNVEQSAASHGSRLYELDEHEPTPAEEVAHGAAAAGEIFSIAAGRGSDDGEIKYNLNLDRVLAGQHEQEAVRVESYLATLQANLVTIDREIEEAERETQNFRAHGRAPRPSGCY